MDDQNRVMLVGGSLEFLEMEELKGIGDWKKRCHDVVCGFGNCSC